MTFHVNEDKDNQEFFEHSEVLFGLMSSDLFVNQCLTDEKPKNDLAFIPILQFVLTTLATSAMFDLSTWITETNYAIIIIK